MDARAIAVPPSSKLVRDGLVASNGRLTESGSRDLFVVRNGVDPVTHGHVWLSAWRAPFLSSVSRSRVSSFHEQCVAQQCVAPDGASRRRRGTVGTGRLVLALRRAPAPQVNAVFSGHVAREIRQPTPTATQGMPATHSAFFPMGVSSTCRRLTATVEESRLKDERKFTALQGQYLSFIQMYTLLHRRPPAEADMQWFFQVTPPSVHNMVLTLEARGLIERVPGKARSIRVLVPKEELPALEQPPLRGM